MKGQLILFLGMAFICSCELIPLKFSYNPKLPSETSYKADAIYGQPSMDFILSRASGTSNPRMGRYNGPGNKTIVADYTNHRVLIWNSPLRSQTQLPDVVLGQTSLSTIAANSPFSVPSANNLSGPFSACTSTDGKKLVVADGVNNRILIWNTFPTTNFQSADVVLGQPDFVSSTANNGGVSEKSLNLPTHLHCAPDGRLYIADSSNHRVLFWNEIPSVSHAPADGVLGQPSLTTNTANNGGRSASALNSPRGIYSDENNFYIADFGNNRVLGWNTGSPSSSSPGDIVLGQPDFTTGSVNNGGISDKSLNGPYDVLVVNNQLLVPEYNNHRILVWNSIPTLIHQSASVVIGQKDFVTSDSFVLNGPGLNNLERPTSLAWDGEYLFIGEVNNRILAYQGVPVVNEQPANFIYGQHSPYTTVAIGTDISKSLGNPYRISKKDNNTYVTENGLKRILIWKNTTPFTSSLPDIVLGQTDFNQSVSGTSNQNLTAIRAVESHNGKIYASDGNRILVWNNIPEVSGAPADLVWGQTDFTTNVANQGGRSASSLMTPTDILITQDEKMIVVDYGNNRVLIFNTIPTTMPAVADVVLGQPGFTTGTANNGGISASSLSGPFCAFVHSGKLFVCDRTNHRVLVWNSIPTSNFAAADLVLGQIDFVSKIKQAGIGEINLSANSIGFNVPQSIATNGKKLFIADFANRRVLVWNKIPTENGTPADAVIGKPNMETIGVMPPSATNLIDPFALYLDGRDLWVAEAHGDRLLRFSSVDNE